MYCNYSKETNKPLFKQQTNKHEINIISSANI